MFTGIIEELGEVKKINSGLDNFELIVEAPKLAAELKTGSSISVNGVCLTITKKDNSLLSMDLMPETLKRTNLNELKEGDKLNLEGALRANGRFEGHIVQGHVDGIAEIIETTPNANAIDIKVKTDKEISKYLVEKGSVAIDGISLTVIEAKKDYFSVSIIPYTAENTTLGFKKEGSKVNLEVDILGKYIASILNK